MKRFIPTLIAVLLAGYTMSGQNLVIGNRAPAITVQRWIGKTPDLAKKVVMVEFFHSANASSVNRLSELDRLARDMGSGFVVVVIAYEDDDEVAGLLTGVNPAYFAAIDDSRKTFASFGASYVPFSVIYNRKGRVVWLGNPVSADEDEMVEIIHRHLK